ncbi:hypothetical protein EJ06DRAFT_332438 [Trichodelitschia bisporula]|uniref:Uncharacterized protein n=1 Tax=Trichodelitschia bisporula TaxID=703511 RepID=A0A6G1I294_9PEZI|nr:hypothetical protein EJ06DRAFT_332438 [Trichodelitschia bisporula]
MKVRSIGKGIPKLSAATVRGSNPTVEGAGTAGDPPADQICLFSVFLAHPLPRTSPLDSSGPGYRGLATPFIVPLHQVEHPSKVTLRLKFVILWKCHVFSHVQGHPRPISLTHITIGNRVTADIQMRLAAYFCIPQHLHMYLALLDFPLASQRHTLHHTMLHRTASAELRASASAPHATRRVCRAFELRDASISC